MAPNLSLCWSENVFEQDCLNAESQHIAAGGIYEHGANKSTLGVVALETKCGINAGL